MELNVTLKLADNHAVLRIRQNDSVSHGGGVVAVLASDWTARLLRNSFWLSADASLATQTENVFFINVFYS